MAIYEHIEHPLPPLYDGASRVLILGTMPSPKAREVMFYYGNPQNRFWRVIAKVFDEELPPDHEGKRAFAHRHHIALSDVLKSCDIVGASDASIKNPVPNDFADILEAAPIQAIFTTGTKATRLYKKLCEPITKRCCIGLPSTSPANAAMSTDDLVERYRIIRAYAEA